jgi:hypothetical protein
MTATIADITRFRGDTAPDQFILKNSAGAVVDISTGYSFVFTLNREENPSDTVNQVYTLAGVVTNGPAGLFEFRPTSGNVNLPAAMYFYDVQVVDPLGYIKTIEKGAYEFTQDISKS